MELANRDDIEADFALKLSRLSTKRRKQLEQLMGSPPDINNVPDQFWDDVQQELNNNMLTILLLIAAGSAYQHLPADGFGGVPRADVLSRLRSDTLDQAMASAAKETSAGFVDHSRELLNRMAGEWRQQEESTVPTKSEILDDLLKIFGPDRAAGIATTETTRAQHFGGESAIAATVGISQEDIWRTRPYLGKVCPTCETLNNTPRSYWAQFFPQGPPQPHPRCNCFVEFANQPAEVVAQ